MNSNVSAAHLLVWVNRFNENIICSGVFNNRFIFVGGHVNQRSVEVSLPG